MDFTVLIAPLEHKVNDPFPAVASRLVSSRLASQKRNPKTPRLVTSPDTWKRRVNACRCKIGGGWVLRGRVRGSRLKTVSVLRLQGGIERVLQVPNLVMHQRLCRSWTWLAVYLYKVWVRCIILGFLVSGCHFCFYAGRCRRLHEPERCDDITFVATLDGDSIGMGK